MPGRARSHLRSSAPSAVHSLLGARAAARARSKFNSSRFRFKVQGSTVQPFRVQGSTVQGSVLPSSLFSYSPWFAISGPPAFKVQGSGFNGSGFSLPVFPSSRLPVFAVFLYSVVCDFAAARVQGSRFKVQRFRVQSCRLPVFPSSLFSYIPWFAISGPPAFKVQGSGFNGSGFNGSGFNGSGFNGSGFNGSGFSLPVFPVQTL